MQTRKDEHFESFEQGPFDELQEKMQGKFERKEIDSATIAKLPEVGRGIEINGLKFKVQQITRSGNVLLEPLGK